MTKVQKRELDIDSISICEFLVRIGKPDSEGTRLSHFLNDAVAYFSWTKNKQNSHLAGKCTRFEVAYNGANPESIIKITVTDYSDTPSHITKPQKP